MTTVRHAVAGSLGAVAGVLSPWIVMGRWPGLFGRPGGDNFLYLLVGLGSALAGALMGLTTGVAASNRQRHATAFRREFWPAGCAIVAGALVGVAIPLAVMGVFAAVVRSNAF